MSKFVKLLAMLPITAKFRGKLYSLISKNVDHSFSIGFGSYIDARDIVVGKNVSIGNLVRVKYLDLFSIGNDSSIGSSTIVCGASEENKVGKRYFKIGSRVGITSSHYFDIVSPIIIGNDVTIGGKQTQFYTHSFDLNRNRLDGAIKIGSNIYIGAGCIINLGVSICDNTVIQGGTCVNQSITESGVYKSTMDLQKRGSVRLYSDLYGNNKHSVLPSGITVYEKDWIEYEKNHNG